MVSFVLRAAEVPEYEVAISVGGGQPLVDTPRAEGVLAGYSH
jgi:hypothetical protein